MRKQEARFLQYSQTKHEQIISTTLCNGWDETGHNQSLIKHSLEVKKLIYKYTEVFFLNLIKVTIYIILVPNCTHICIIVMRWQHSSELTLRCHHKKYYVLDLKETVRKPGLNQLVRDHIAGPVQSNTPITACQKGSPDLVSSLATCNFTPTCLYCPVFIFMLDNPSFFFQVPCPPCSF